MPYKRRYSSGKYGKRSKASISRKRSAMRGRRLQLSPPEMEDLARKNDEIVRKYKILNAKLKMQGRKSVSKLRGRHGASAVDAASGDKSSFYVGKRTRLKSKLARRQDRILKAISDNRFPVIKNHEFQSVSQIDWTGGNQAYVEYNLGYSTSEIEAMMTQSNDAQAVNVTAVVVQNPDTTKNQRVDIYDKTTKLRMKNTCSHTVYLELIPYESKYYHTFTVMNSWTTALAADNMYQNPLNYGVEEAPASMGLRPDMRQADMNVRWKVVKEGCMKITLEPGQEFCYTYVQRGGRYDQAKFNVLQGSATGGGTDIEFLPGLSSRLMVFARAELVADSVDNDVTMGSGHVAVNAEIWKTWAAVPYIRPYQTSMQNGWGTILEAQELDINQYQANADAYEEQV